MWINPNQHIPTQPSNRIEPPNIIKKNNKKNARITPKNPSQKIQLPPSKFIQQHEKPLKPNPQKNNRNE